MALSRVSGFHVCSARQCTEVARWAVIWRNPRIHQAREKTWLACEGHKEFLAEFVALRGFPYRIVPVSELGEPVGQSAKQVDPRSLTAEERKIFEGGV
ncbi:hypothetical protein HMPREF0044_0492 [Gleimia coleocanis DSM 15436]|uniref:Acetone carboxylase n=1 Tax=Gleimia coleocanis DSM 15436 TaxID=525245 RepID=C0VZA2_9ACTO|nr:hypothetical protein [Gleimia coleocanis]EEH64203.1 hypothetical protein HMPREF0044_0492 [Gleimia coleocanis DSM 15436]